MMTRILALLLLVGSMFAPTLVQEAQAQQQLCFAETGQCIEGRVREFWEQNGGLPVFGLPVTAQQPETLGDGKTYTVQWFERNRLELHPENARPYDVLLGRLGADRLAQQGRDPFTFPKSSGPESGCRYFAETQQNVCGDILATWRSSGIELDGQGGSSESESLALWGLPLSAPTVETLGDGRQYTVQWFERARFELHPENGPPTNVLLGLLGNEIRGGSGGGQQQAPPAEPPADPCADVPPPVSAEIAPRCAIQGTTFVLSVFGFEPNEEVGFWITVPDGSILGTRRTVNIGPTGGVENLPLETDSSFPPGLYYLVFQGTKSGHQAIAYFKVLAP